METLKDVHKIQDAEMNKFIEESVKLMMKPLSSNLKEATKKMVKSCSKIVLASSLIAGGIGLATGYYIKKNGAKALKGLQGGRRLGKK